MKKHLALVFSTGLTAITLVAQEPPYPPLVNPPVAKTNPTKGSKETAEETKITTDSGTTKTSTDTLTGKVEEYEPGKWIRISTPGKTEGSRTVDLQGKDVTAHVNSGVKKDAWANVIQKTDSNGHKIDHNSSSEGRRPGSITAASLPVY
jgi:hypothetical protein